MARRKRVIYQNGTCFAVPLRDGGFALGVVARSNGKGIAFGYFFGPRLSSPEDANISEALPKQSIYVGKFGDLALINGEWPILGSVPGWRPEEWPMPALARLDETANRAWVSEYDEHSFTCLSESEIDPKEVSTFVADGTMGYGAIEIRLTKLLQN